VGTANIKSTTVLFFWFSLKLPRIFYKIKEEEEEEEEEEEFNTNRISAII